MARLKQWLGATPDKVGRLFVVSAPSGTGKTSLVKAVLEHDPSTRMSVSFTTRPMRPAEREGQDYFFVDQARFQQLQAAGEMLESAEVFGNFYGTGKGQVDALLNAGHNVILEIDWQGAQQVRKAAPECKSIFILPPSCSELERRLRNRKTDSDEVIARRLGESVADMGHWAEFDYVVVNDDFNQARDALSAIIGGGAEQYASTAPNARAVAQGIVNGAD
ncbi:MAG: guanylate kinase [Gammaproteobacteria bacterium]